MYYLEKLVAHLLIFLFTSFQLQGQEKVPRQGPLLIVSNHLSVSDPVILGTKLGRKVTFMAKEELFKNFIHRYFVRSFNAFPVYRQGSNREALRQAGEVLRQGKVLGMFPEGKRSREIRLMPALYGSALIAYHNQVSILPVGISGTEKIHGFGWIWHRPVVKVKIGGSFRLPDAGHSLRKEQLAAFTEIIMQHIAELLPEEYRGEYTERNLGADRDQKS